jgi:glycosyltransferase involved in cell wall biosynthesis
LARLGIYCPVLPPTRGGLADATRTLAAALHARGVTVTVLGKRGDAATLAPVPAEVGIAARGPALAAAVERHGLAALLVQYVPFAYARRGLAPGLAPALRRARAAGARIGVFVHEPYVPFTRLAWWVTGWPMRWQFRALVRAADVVFSPVPGFLELARRARTGATRFITVPTGSTIPVAAVTREAARTALGLGAADIAVGVFSPGTSGALHDWIARAAARLSPDPRVLWLFYGNGGDRPPARFPAGARVRCLGWVAPEKASGVLHALDLAAGAFADGLTLRRTSVMAALAHGVPVVSSQGHLFDPALADAAACAPTAEAFAEAVAELVGDRPRREALGRAGQAFYEAHASAAVAAARIAAALEVG